MADPGDSPEQSNQDGVRTRAQIKAGRKRTISQLAGELPSSREARKQKATKNNEVIVSFINQTAEQVLQEADSMRSRRAVADYSYVLNYGVDNRVESVTLPADFNTNTNSIDKLIAYLVKICELEVIVEDTRVNKLEEDVPDILTKYVSGIITAFASEAILPTVWKEKDQPMEIAKQAILWKRFEGWFTHKDLKPTHQFRFCSPTVSGSGEKTSFNKFYVLLSKQTGEHSAQRAKLVKSLIQIASVAHAIKDISTVLDAHKISKAEICREAKPQTEDKTKKRRKGMSKTYITKQIWDPETFPFLTQCEKLYLKSLKSVYTKAIKAKSDEWDDLPSLDQYINYKTELSKFKKLYQNYYQEVDRISTRLHRRRTLFETYLRKNNIADPKGTKLLKSTVAHFETQKATPKNLYEFALVMDPRNVLQPVVHGRFTNPNVTGDNQDETWATAGAVCDDFHSKYPDYNTAPYTDNITLCRTTNIFRNLKISEDDEYSSGEGDDMSD
jgi:hypothetical protein